MWPKSSIEKAMDCIGQIPDPDLRKLCERSMLQTAHPVTMVESFHKVYGLPIIQSRNAKADFSHISKERLAMRFGLIAEEFKELCKAMDLDTTILYNYQNEEGETVTTSNIVEAFIETEERDIVEVADACADLKYVIIGFELENGIPSDPVFREVHASNMSKLGVDGKPVYREDGKVLKGPNYFKANIARVINAYGIGLGKPFTRDLSDILKD